APALASRASISVVWPAPACPTIAMSRTAAGAKALCGCALPTPERRLIKRRGGPVWFLSYRLESRAHSPGRPNVDLADSRRLAGAPLREPGCSPGSDYDNLIRRSGRRGDTGDTHETSGPPRDT